MKWLTEVLLCLCTDALWLRCFQKVLSKSKLVLCFVLLSFLGGINVSRWACRFREYPRQFASPLHWRVHKRISWNCTQWRCIVMGVAFKIFLAWIKLIYMIFAMSKTTNFSDLVYFLVVKIKRTFCHSNTNVDRLRRYSPLF